MDLSTLIGGLYIVNYLVTAIIIIVLWAILEVNLDEYNIKFKGIVIDDILAPAVSALVPGVGILVIAVMINDIKKTKGSWGEIKREKEQRIALTNIQEKLEKIERFYLYSDIDGTFDFYSSKMELLVRDVEKHIENPVIKYLLFHYEESIEMMEEVLGMVNNVSKESQKELIKKVSEVIEEIVEEVETFKKDNEYVLQKSEQEKVEQKIAQLEAERKRKKKPYSSLGIRSELAKTIE